LASAAGNQGLSPRARGVYRDLAATAPKTLDHVLGPKPATPGSPSGSSGGPSPGPSGPGPAVPPAPQPSRPPQQASPPTLPAADDGRVVAFAKWATGQRGNGGSDHRKAAQAMRALSGKQRADVAALWGAHARAAGDDNDFVVEMARRAAAEPPTGGAKDAYLALGAARSDVLGRLFIDGDSAPQDGDGL
jgi:hypothetical protein